MAIIDADMMMNAPKGLTSSSGIDAVSHNLEALVSVMATDFTDGIAKQSLQMIFEYLPRAYDNGPMILRQERRWDMLLVWQVWLLQMHSLA